MCVCFGAIGGGIGRLSFTFGVLLLVPVDDLFAVCLATVGEGLGVPVIKTEAFGVADIPIFVGGVGIPSRSCCDLNSASCLRAISFRTCACNAGCRLDP